MSQYFRLPSLSQLSGLSLVLNGSVSGSLTMLPAATTTSYTLTWPSAQGGVGSYLSNNGSGTLSWAAAPLSASLPVNQIFVGSAGGIATAQAMSGEASIVAAGSVTLANSAVIGKVLTGYSSGSGTVLASDTILQAIQKLNGNAGLYLPLAGGTMLGTITSAGGTVSLPSITWGDASTGFYRPGVGQVSFAAVGAQVLNLGTSGAAVTGLISATTTITATGALKSLTSLILEDPGAGTNTTTIQSGTVGTSYALTLPTDVAASSNSVLISSNAGALTYAVAASANTASAIVQRDGSGNFSAGTITASLTGTATTSTVATTGTTVSVSNSASYFPLFVASSSNSNQAFNLGTGLSFNPSTNNLSTTTFTGALSGNATTSTTASVATTGTTVAVSNSASYFPLFAASSSNGNQAFNLGAGLSFNPSTNNLTTTTFTGALVGNSSTSTTATNATNVATTATTTNAEFYPLFVSSSTNSNQAASLKATLFTFNPSTVALSCTTFIGALTGAASGNLSATANQYGVLCSGSANVATVIAPVSGTRKVLTTAGTSANPTWTEPLTVSYLTATSNSAALNATNVYSNANTGNTVTLTAGEWDITGAIYFNNAGALSYTFYSVGWYEAQGTGTGTPPTALGSSITVLAGGPNAMRSAYPLSTSDEMTLPASSLRVSVSGSVAIYLVALATVSTAANSRVTCYLKATKVG